MSSTTRTTITTVGLGLALLAAPLAAAGPGVLKFDESSFEVLESAAAAMVRVERSNGEDGAVSVSYRVEDGTATAGQDYAPVSGTLSWANQDGATKTFMIPLMDDSIDEANETIRLFLENPTGGAGIDSQRGTSIVRVLDDDGGPGDDGPGDDGPGDDGPGDDGPGDDGPGDDGPGDDNPGGDAGSLKFDERSYVGFEGAGVALITVERSHGETGEVSVEYAVQEGTAKAGEDFVPTSGVLVWANGDESRKVFEVQLVKDDGEEPPETVELLLGATTGGAGLEPGRSTAILTIVDDDQGAGPGGDDGGSPGILKFAERTFQVVEGDTMATVAVERSKGESGSVSVTYAAEQGSATGGLDFTPVTGTLTWGPGDERVKRFQVPIFGDGDSEGNETVLLALSDPTGGAALSAERSAATLVILDDDGQTTACVEDSETLCLADDRFKAEVSWKTKSGNGRAIGVPFTDDSGLFWFFSENNIEMLVKVLDACSLQGFENYWVFFAATTDVGFTLRVTDTVTGLTKEYSSPYGMAAAPVTDTASFKTCP